MLELRLRKIARDPNLDRRVLGQGLAIDHQGGNLMLRIELQILGAALFALP